MFLNRNKTQRFKTVSIKKCAMHMAFDQAGHQGSAATVDHPRAVTINLRAIAGNAANAIALNQHFARERISTTGIQNLYSGKDDLANGNLRFLWGLVCNRAYCLSDLSHK
jgi:hypothetical protein